MVVVCAHAGWHAADQTNANERVKVETGCQNLDAASVRHENVVIRRNPYLARRGKLQRPVAVAANRAHMRSVVHKKHLNAAVD
jgi:hypothetical protein